MRNQSLTLIKNPYAAGSWGVEYTSEPQAGEAVARQDDGYEANRMMVGSFILILFGAMIGWLSHFMI